MKRRIVAFMLVFMFCVTCVGVYQTFGDEHDHIHAATSSSSDKIAAPQILFYATGGSDDITSNDLNDIKLKANVDHENKTLKLTFIIKGLDDGVSDLRHCRTGAFKLTYDQNIFDFEGVSGFFMETAEKYLNVNSSSFGVINITLDEDSSEEYPVGSEFTFEFSYDKADISKLSGDSLEKKFNASLTVYSSKYEEGSYTRAIDVYGCICPHETEFIKDISYAATCNEYARVEKTCQHCGRIIEKSYTGRYYGNHVYDYCDFVRQISTYSYCRSNGATIEVKCQECGKLVRVTDLEYHTGINSKTTKKYNKSTDTYNYHCSGCDEDVVAKIQKGNSDTCEHEFKIESSVPATCTSTGLDTKKCTKCGLIQTEITEKKEHAYGSPEVLTAATCTSTGVTKYTCADCKNTKEEITSALGHSFGENTIITSATCVNTGSATHTCTRCQLTETVTLPVDANAHKYPETWTVSVKGTCSIKEVQTRTCEYCQHVDSKTLDFGNHSYIETVVSKHTCYEDGLSIFTCEYCKDTYEEETKCTGHNFSTATSDGKTETSVCTECQMTIAVTKKSGKVTKTVSHNGFSVTIKGDLAQRTIDLRVTAIDTSSDEYVTNNNYIKALGTSVGKNYSIQNAYHVKLYIDGVETKFTSDMSVSYALDTALANSKVKMVYYKPGSTGAVIIEEMKSTSRKNGSITMKGKVLSEASNDTFILAIEGNPITSNGGVVVPGNTSSSSNLIVPIAIVALCVLATVAVIVIVINNSKKEDRF